MIFPKTCVEKQKVAFILVRPQLPENIGTTLRALWNCGQTDLRLVSPKHPWPCEKGVKAAAGALRHPHDVKVFSCLASAVSDLEYVIATTARARDMVKPVYSLKALSEKLPQKQKIGFLFGPERTGLTSEDVSWAQGILTIPLNPAYTSLNLAQCVLLVAHTLWCMESDNQAEETAPTPLATHEDLRGMLKHLESVLMRSGFFYPPEMAPKMMQNIRNAFTRTLQTEQEVRTFRGIVRHFEKILDGRLPKLLQEKSKFFDKK